MSYKDHLGNEYPSFTAMCVAYNKPQNTVRNRLSRKWSLEEALTIDNTNTCAKVNHIKTWYDHLGNSFNSVREMAEHYGITEKIFWSRKRILKWPLEKILTTPVQDIESPSNAKSITCNGQTFKSINALCKHYGIPRSTFKLRMSQGYTPEEAINIQPNPVKGFNKRYEKCKDPWGNEFNSKSEMYRHYGVSKDLVTSRLKLGWTLEDILSKPDKINSAKPCVDPKGIEHSSFKDMAKFYGLSEATLRGRLAQGYSLQDALIDWEKHSIETDHLNNQFASKSDKYAYWNISIGTYHARKQSNKSEKQCLETIMPNQKFDDLIIIKKITDDYYEVSLNDKSYIWSKSQIWAYYHSNHSDLLYAKN